MAESAAGILNGDRTHISVTCYMLLSALHLADSNICHSLCLARRRRKGTGPKIPQHIPLYSIPWVWNDGPKPIPFWARDLAHDDDFCNLSSSRLALSVFLCISSCRAKVCVVLAYPKFGAGSQWAKTQARCERMYDADAADLKSQAESSAS